MKKSKNKNNTKINKKLILSIAVAVVILVIIVVTILFVKNKVEKMKNISSSLNTETWLNANQKLTITNESDTVTLSIDSELDYVEGSKFELPYTLVVNGVEYNCEYTFATGYSIQNEPNIIPYRVSFTGIKEGSVGVIVTKN
jgi:hypothetical protein